MGFMLKLPLALILARKRMTLRAGLNMTDGYWWESMRRWELMVLKSPHRDADYHWDIDIILYIHVWIDIYSIEQCISCIPTEVCQEHVRMDFPGYIESRVFVFVLVWSCMYRHMYDTILYRVMICTHTHTMSWNSRLWFWQFIWAHRPGLWTANPSHGESCAVSLLRV